MPSFVGENVLVTPPIGPADAIGDRQYDDGFVRLDGSTAIDGLLGKGSDRAGSAFGAPARSSRRR